MFPPPCLQKGLGMHRGTSNLSGEGLENIGKLHSLHPHPHRGSAFQSFNPKDREYFPFFLFGNRQSKSVTGGWEFGVQQ